MKITVKILHDKTYKIRWADNVLMINEYRVIHVQNIFEIMHLPSIITYFWSEKINILELIRGVINIYNVTNIVIICHLKMFLNSLLTYDE